MYSRARIANHPLHPLLVTLPIGAFVFALVSHLVFLGTKDPFWLTATYWLAITAVTTGLFAAIFGLTDWFAIPNDAEAKGVATWHMVLNVTIVALYFVAWLMLGGFSGPTATIAPTFTVPLGLEMVGTVLLLVSGWLGGNMVYQHHVAVEPFTTEEAQMIDSAERRRAA